MGDFKGKHLIIRADASTQIGSGHLMRCLALAQAWKDAGGKTIFITACQSEGLLQRLRDEGIDIHLLSHPHPDSADWTYTKNVLDKYPNAWVVLDGYHFDESYQQWVKESKHRLLVIDDMAHLKHYYADIVLNQNLHAEQLHYSCEPYTRFLLGSRYVLLRREFFIWKNRKREIPKVAQRLLVTLGGGDRNNHTLKVIKALQRVKVDGLEATVVIGANNPHASVLEATIRQSPIPMRLIHDAENMPELMTWADLAVSASGTTIWELLFLGTPILALISADNQFYVADKIEAYEVGRNLGAIKEISVEDVTKAITLLIRDFDSRAKMCENGRRIVDGLGAQRVIDVMSEISDRRLRLRLATSEDCRMVWEWANEPDVRAASFNLDLIKWEEHVEWFKTKLENSNCLYYIILNDTGLPIGQVRFDLAGKQAEINISISPAFRGIGFGTEAIYMASERLFSETQITKINANIKQGNTVSTKAFAKAGYKEMGVKEVKGQQAFHMTIEKHNVPSKNDAGQD